MIKSFLRGFSHFFPINIEEVGEFFGVLFGIILSAVVLVFVGFITIVGCTWLLSILTVI